MNATEQIDRAVQSERAAPAASNPDVSVPNSGDAAVRLPKSGGIGVKLPAAHEGRQSGVTRIFDGSANGTTVAVQPTKRGVRALVNIQTRDAPEAYRFPLVDASRVIQNGDDSLFAYDAKGELVAAFAPPWARDAQGRRVPTHYEVSGTTITQIVDHRAGNFAYGITADPFGIGFDDVKKFVGGAFKKAVAFNGLVCFVRESTKEGDTNAIKDDLADGANCLNPLSGYTGEIPGGDGA